MKRESFVFYDSWMEAIEELPSVELRNEAMSAVVMYGLGKQSEEDWEQLNPFVRALLKIIKPMVDKNYKLWENAKKGGRKKVTDSSDEVLEEENQPNQNQNEDLKNQNETKTKPNANQNKDLVGKSENQAHKNNVNVNVNVNDNVNVNSLSPSRACAEGSRLSGTERDRALLFLFFTKKIKHPEKELAKFEAYYAARGWKDPQGREIVDPIALLESWDIKNAKDTLTRQEVQLWEKLVNVLIKHNAFAPIVLSGFKSVEFRNDENLAIYGTKEMKRYLDQIFSEKVFNDLKRAFSAKGINYCQIN